MRRLPLWPAAIVTGTLVRLLAHFVTPPALAGLDTLVPPLFSLAAFVTTCQLTWKTIPGRHEVIAQPATVMLPNAVDA